MNAGESAGVCVVIVTWNAATLIDGVLAALDAQTLPPRRVLVIDNGSADAARLPAIVGAHPRCELVDLPDNRGFAAANNIGIARCTEEFVALLNPDAYPAPGWLEALVAAAHAHPRAASFASRMLDHADARLLDGAGDALSLAGRPMRRGHGAAAAGAYLRDEEIFAPCAAAALYRRDALVACEGFDERFFCYVEDIDLGFRLRLAGHGSRYVPGAVVRHIGSALTGRRSDFAVYHGQRNLVFNFTKNMPGLLFWLLLPLHLVLNVGHTVIAIAVGRGRPVLAAKRDALRALPGMLRSRRDIQRGRVARVRDIWRVLAKRRLFH